MAEEKMTVRGLSMTDIPVVEPEYWPEAVEFWSLHGGNKKLSAEAADMKVKAKKHLAFLHWKFWYAHKGTRRELRYTSTTGATYYSLRAACQGCIEEALQSIDTKRKCNLEGCEDSSKRMRDDSEFDQPCHNRPILDLNFDENLVKSKAVSLSPEADQEDLVSWQLAGPDIIGSVKFCPIAVLKYAQKRDNQLVEDLRRHLVCLSWKIEYANTKGANGKIYQRFRYTSPSGTCYYSLAKLCQDMCNFGLQPPSVAEESENESLQPTIDDLKGELPIFPAQSGKVIEKIESMRQETLPWTPYLISRTVFGTLIGQNIVSAGDKVHYRCKSSGKALKTGIITLQGIKCDCCDKFFNLTAFEAHSGSNLHRPAANIFLEDGRSLMDCQGHLSRGSSCTIRENQGRRANQIEDESDIICSACHNGGTLILCDGCPSCFHQNCLGLQDVPVGAWFCPICRCVICQQVDKSLLACEQCELKYHPRCLKTVVENSETSHQDKWFCSVQCKMVHSGLHELLRVPIPLSDNNLTWTLLKPNINGDGTVSYKNLNAALDVLRECFHSCAECYTGRDIVEDVIYSRRSKLKRMDFKGFYTVVLLKDEEVASVAAVRVFGTKVAEVPLVATRFKFQKQGMCRILMNKLEDMLKALAVEKLVLPAVPSTLDTWTTKFRFSKMTESDKTVFLNYVFLVFPDIILCQKSLASEPVVIDIL